MAFANGYSYRRTITITPGGIGGDLTNFPFLFRGTETDFRTTANGGRVTNASGYDIIFTSDTDGASILNFEIITWDASTGLLTAAVQIPTLSSSGNTLIYLFYGNSSVTTPQSPASAWDSSYRAVYHLGSTPPGASTPNGTVSPTDSSSHPNNMTVNGTVPAGAGWLQAQGANFPAAGEYLSAPNQTAIHNLGAGAMTVEFWMRINTLPTRGPSPVQKEGDGSAGWAVYVNSNNVSLQRVFTGPAYYKFNATGSLPSDIKTNFHHIVVAFDGVATCAIYYDSVLQTVNAVPVGGSYLDDSALPLQLSIGGFGVPWFDQFKGDLCEVRISNVARSADYVKANFLNQSVPQQFYTIDAPGTGPFTGFPLTVAPFQVDPVYQPNFPAGPGNSFATLKPANGKTGPFQIGLNLYQVGTSIGSASSTTPGENPTLGSNIVIEKSIDGGKTWAPKDLNGLTGLGHPGAVVPYQVVFAARATGTKIYVAYVGSTAPSLSADGVYIATFDSASDTWNSITPSISGLSLSNLYIQPNFGLSVPSDGVYNVVVYLLSGIGIASFRYSGGVWTGPTSMPFPYPLAFSASFIGWDVNPSNNDLYTWFSIQRSGGSWDDTKPNPLCCTILHSTGVWESDPIHPGYGGTIVVSDMKYNNLASPLETYPSCIDSMAFLGSVWIASFQAAPYLSGDPILHTSWDSSLRPACVSPSGLFVLSSDNTDLVNVQGQLWGTTAITLNGTGYVFWTATNLLGTDFDGEAIARIRYCTTTDGAHFSSPLLAYDAELNPPPNYVDPNYAAISTANQIATGIYQPNAIVIGTKVCLTFSYGAYYCDEQSELFTGRAYFFLPVIGLSCPSSSANIGSAYSSSFVVTGGTAPFTFSISSGSLPPGLSLGASTGIVSGTPTTAGTYSYTGSVTDSEGNTATSSCSIIVPGSPVNVICALQITALVNQPYSSSVVAYGGTPPYTFSITAGNLPPGLSLNSSTGAITGTPTSTGTFGYTITVTDSDSSGGSSNCSITVSVCPDAL